MARVGYVLPAPPFCTGTTLFEARGVEASAYGKHPCSQAKEQHKKGATRHTRERMCTNAQPGRLLVALTHPWLFTRAAARDA